ncbi:hypothetical protein LTR36_002376 [Oleoguttula mirabilis]|uniref:Uncharacterized protein n=1 Tax=Oleoguttula mirabilis TaxID=1507867 RepID=A0AAV9JLU3_9PEZI|nr:hypothetical protein LTR36_002376 [Oleoguttula mirabilis]
MADSDATILGANTLLTSPQELQDLIFDYAYPAQTDFRPVSRGLWDSREKRRRRDNHDRVLQPFPVLKVNELLVSKTFFVAAARAFVGNQHFENIDELLSTNGGISTGMAFQWATSVTVSTWENRVYRLPSLRSMALKLDQAIFEVLEPKYAWLETCDQDELKQIELYTRLVECETLRVFKPLAKPCIWAKTEVERQTYLSSVVAFGVLVCAELKKPKDQIRSPTPPCRGEPVPIYRSSEVHLPTTIPAEPSPRHKHNTSAHEGQLRNTERQYEGFAKVNDNENMLATPALEVDIPFRTMPASATPLIQVAAVSKAEPSSGDIHSTVSTASMHVVAGKHKPTLSRMDMDTLAVILWLAFLVVLLWMVTDKA